MNILSQIQRAYEFQVCVKKNIMAMEECTTSSSTINNDDLSWTSWFCSRNGNEYFCEIDDSFILDRFNMTGLPDMVILYRQALNVILDDAPSDMDTSINYGVDPAYEMIQKSAETLYGLIHARYVLSVEGLLSVMKKYRQQDYGICPKVFCNKAHLLPMGLSDKLNESTVKCYCPSCCDIFEPKSTKHRIIDGAFFGTGLPHMLFMSYPQLRPKGPVYKYVPSLYGFKIHYLSYNAQDN